MIQVLKFMFLSSYRDEEQHILPTTNKTQTF